MKCPLLKIIKLGTIFIRIPPPPDYIFIGAIIKIVRVNWEPVHLYENPPRGSREKVEKL